MSERRVGDASRPRVFRREADRARVVSGRAGGRAGGTWAKAAANARRLAALVLAGAVAGCVDPAGAFLWGPIDAAGSVAVRPELALVRLPEVWAGRRLAVRREVVLNRLTERVVLANDTALPFENRIEARTAWRGIAGSPFLRELPDGPFEAGAVEEFAARQFPGATEMSGPTEGVNRNGPYAYLRAAYADDGPSCVYAWQVVDASVWLDRRAHGFALDLRYCAPAGGDADALALFDSIALRPEY